MVAKRIVGIAELAVSNDPTEVLVTYSLGSCVGISLFDPVHRVGGLIHCKLPYSEMDLKRAYKRPSLFVDTGITSLLSDLLNAGGRKEHVIARVVGGATLIRTDKDVFQVGRQNYEAARRNLFKQQILVAAEAVGGTASRTTYLVIASGATMVKSRGRMFELK